MCAPASNPASDPLSAATNVAAGISSNSAQQHYNIYSIHAAEREVVIHGTSFTDSGSNSNNSNEVGSGT